MKPDYKHDVNRNNIVMSLEGRLIGYAKKIDMNMANDNPEGARVYIKHIQAIMDFIDGIK